MSELLILAGTEEGSHLAGMPLAVNCFFWFHRISLFGAFHETSRGCRKCSGWCRRRQISGKSSARRQTALPASVLMVCTVMKDLFARMQTRALYKTDCLLISLIQWTRNKVKRNAPSHTAFQCRSAALQTRSVKKTQRCDVTIASGREPLRDFTHRA